MVVKKYSRVNIVIPGTIQYIYIYIYRYNTNFENANKNFNDARIMRILNLGLFQTNLIADIRVEQLQNIQNSHRYSLIAILQTSSARGTCINFSAENIMIFTFCRDIFFLLRNERTYYSVPSHHVDFDVRCKNNKRTYYRHF